MFETRQCELAIKLSFDGVSDHPFDPNRWTATIHYTFMYSDDVPGYDEFLRVECWESAPKRLIDAVRCIDDTKILFGMAFPHISFTTRNEQHERLLREVSSLRHHAGPCSCGDE